MIFFLYYLGDGDVRKKMEDMVIDLYFENYIEFTGLVSYNYVMEFLYVVMFV